MKILLMEKFDGISSQIPLWNGRDPRLTMSRATTGGSSITISNPVEVADDLVGLRHSFRFSGNSYAEYSSVLVIKSTVILDINKRYSFIYNGLKTTLNLSRKTSNHTETIVLKLAGTEISRQTITSEGARVYPILDGNVDVYDLELCYSNGKLDIYMNGRLISRKNANIMDDTLLGFSHVSQSTTKVSHVTDGGTDFQLKELIIVELEEGEERVGNCRLERLIVDAVSENLPDPENITPVNLANNTFSQIGEDEVSVTFASPLLKRNERVVGIDYRTSAVGTIDGSQMRVRLETEEDNEVYNEIQNLPLTHTRSSSCNIVTPQQLGESPEDYQNVKVFVSATEELP